jgi:CelD/BcsL family acetyltransferase involved in cellulose biosynthesis
MIEAVLDALPAAESVLQHGPSSPCYGIQVLESIEQLRAFAHQWDDLRQRSEVAAPAIRAESIAQWAEQFAANQSFTAVVVTDGERFVAALPVIVGRRFGLKLGMTPANGWSVHGDLLVDPLVDVEAVLNLLAEAVMQQGWAALWLDHVPFEELRWRQFLHAVTRQSGRWHVKEHYRIGQVQISGDWPAYEASRNGDHRRSRARYSRMLEKAGPTEIEVYRGRDADEVARLVRLGFEIEHRSWKSGSGTSVMQTPGMLEYYVRQAQHVAACDELELVFLKHQGRAIAFDYGWRSKSTHFVCKLGYDDEYRKYGPGQQMIMRLLQQLHADDGCRTLDFWGPLVPWNESWSTASYPVGRVVVPTSSLAGRLLLHGYRDLLPRVRSLRGQPQC